MEWPFTLSFCRVLLSWSKNIWININPYTNKMPKGGHTSKRWRSSLIIGSRFFINILKQCQKLIQNSSKSYHQVLFNHTSKWCRKLIRKSWKSYPKLIQNWSKKWSKRGPKVVPERYQKTTSKKDRFWRPLGTSFWWFLELKSASKKYDFLLPHFFIKKQIFCSHALTLYHFDHFCQLRVDLGGPRQLPKSEK